MSSKGYPDVKESEGVWAEAAADEPRKGWVRVNHMNVGVGLGFRAELVVLSPNDARVLARQLCRQARRWEQAQSK